MQESTPGFAEIFSHFNLDVMWLLVIAAIAVPYAIAYRRSQRIVGRATHPAWKLWSLLAGLAVLAIGVMSPIQHYGNQLLWVDFLGFLLITMIAPPLIVLSSPLTLAFRVSDKAGRRRLRSFYRSGPVRLITFPVVSGLLFAAVTYLWQFSGLTDTAARNTPVREIQELSLFLVALIFWTPALCADPVRWRVAYPLRGLYVFVEMTHKALFGAMFLALDRPVHGDMAARLPAWGPDAITDQRMAIVILWIGGNLIFLATLVGLIVRWMAYEARTTHRTDRRLALARQAARRKQAALDKVFERGV